MSGAALLEPMADPLIGKTLAERYRVVRRIGEGGMGAVYEGEHLVIKKRVAIKVLHATLSTSAEVVARFHQEALAATSIGHEHIVEVNDMGRTPEGALFMVLELLQGRDFADLLEKESPLPIGRVVHIAMQMCDALQAAHDKGIVHRDLKPENVFLVKRGGDPDFAKVLDFGISKMQSSDADAGPRAATRTGAIMGTALYMSPEQAMGKRSVDQRTDIWALGVILYRAITTHYPFLHEAFPALLLQICGDRPTPPAALRSDVDPKLDAIIMRCLEKDPAARPQSCAELLAALAPYRHLTQVMASTRLSVPMPDRTDLAITPASTARERETGPAAFAATAAGIDPPSPTGATGLSGGSREVSGSSALASDIRASTPVRASVAVGAGVLGLAAVAAVAFGVSRMGAAPATIDAPPIVAPTTAAEPSTPAHAGPSIEFVVSPSEAAVLVDGRPVAARDDGSLRHQVDDGDVVIHELRVEARGFRSRVEDLRLSYPQRIVIALDPGAGVDDRRASATGAALGSAMPTSATPTSATPASSAGGAHRRRSERGETTTSTATTTTAAATTAAPATPAPAAAVTGRDDEGQPRPDPRPEAATPSPAPDGVVVPPPRRGLRRIEIGGGSATTTPSP